MKPGKPLTFAKVPVPEQNRCGAASAALVCASRPAALLLLSLPPLPLPELLAPQQCLPHHHRPRPRPGACWCSGCRATRSAAW